MNENWSCEDWDEFREDCQTFAWRAGELQLACWKIVALIENRLENETRADSCAVLNDLRKEGIAQVDILLAWQKHLEKCDTDEIATAEAIGLASYAIRKIIAWPERKSKREQEEKCQKVEAATAEKRDIEYSMLNANSDSVGVWSLRFILEDT